MCVLSLVLKGESARPTIKRKIQICAGAGALFFPQESAKNTAPEKKAPQYRATVYVLYTLHRPTAVELKPKKKIESDGGTYCVRIQ